MEIYEVGGCVRDRLLGLQSKDIDYTVVLSPEEVGTQDPYYVMCNLLEEMGLNPFLHSPEYFTVRGKFEDSNVTADYVLARKDGPYTDGRRPDYVELGTLYDDLERRDFTMNAIAVDSLGNLIDPHQGVRDIELGLICTVGDPVTKIEDDALRAVRALRFSVTKYFDIEFKLHTFLKSDYAASLVETVSDDRISQELSKMFRFSTVDSLHVLGMYPKLTKVLFSGNVSLDSTLKTKGRGK